MSSAWPGRRMGTAMSASCRTSSEEHAVEIDGDAAAPLLEGEIDDVGEHGYAGVVDEDVEASPALFGEGDDLGPTVLVDDVRAEEGGAVAELPGDRMAVVGDVGEEHLGALFREAARGGLAETGSGAGDDCTLPSRAAMALLLCSEAMGTVNEQRAQAGCAGPSARNGTAGRPSSSSWMNRRWHSPSMYSAVLVP